MEALWLLMLVPVLFGLGDLFGSDDDKDEDSTINGTEGDDTLEGDADDETINALEGDDSVRGHGGEDTVFAGDGADEVAGDNGNDNLHGQGGDDLLRGGAGEDLLVGDEGDDILGGEADDDTLFAGYGDDWVDGGAGNDTIWMGEGDDTLINVYDHEEEMASLGDDKVSGGGGNDEIRDFAGRDTLSGELGDDVMDAVDDPETESPDILFGGWGHDTLIGDDGDVMSGGGSADDFTIYLNEEDDQAVTITDFDADRDELYLEMDFDLFPDGQDDLATATDPDTGDVSLFLGTQLIAVFQAPAGEFSIEKIKFLSI